MASDHFSTQSRQYSLYRPRYPSEMIDWIASLAPSKQSAWDCACGSGQATVELAKVFDSVIATDMSAAQIAQSPPLANVLWRVAPAEDSQIETASIDLVTVAQALHWFDLDRFWGEVRRVLRPGGVVAVWSYGVAKVGHGRMAEICDHFYRVTLDHYWPPERKIVEAGYGILHFPFEEIEAPIFNLQCVWSLDELIGYFSSWSACERYRIAIGVDPTVALRESLAEVWDGSPIEVTWPISMRVGTSKPVHHEQ
jgi:SAM-dependent methyltransferase